ncbi:MAG: hypothetical protein WCH39_09180, partial [Schlesneria sp.]
RWPTRMNFRPTLGRADVRCGLRGLHLKRALSPNINGTLKPACLESSHEQCKAEVIQHALRAISIGNNLMHSDFYCGISGGAV